MLWQKGRRSDNVEQDSGSGSGYGGGGMRFGGRGLSLGGIVIIVIVSFLLGKNPLEMLGLITGDDGGVTSSAPGQTTAPASNDPQVDFVRAIVGSTEDVWAAAFQKSGSSYAAPKLTLFHGRVRSACGTASASMGPFYCPNDRKVYLDLDFFHEMDTRFHATGDFARAYVIAHEVGHHVQNLIGVFDTTDKARQRGAAMEGASGLSVRMELQADCFAGVWANQAQRQLQWLETGDIEAALNAASSVGDDRLQKQGQGYVVPDSFTHGSSAQRMRWFKAGFDGGDSGRCDTFKAGSL